MTNLNTITTGGRDRLYRRLLIAYWIEALAVLAAVSLLRPIDDDWFFLRYFPEAGQWGVNTYSWLGDCILLMRDYWRPLEDLTMTALASHAPWLFPGLQHTLIVAMAFGAGRLAWSLGVAAGAGRRAMGVTMMAGMLAATGLGALTSVDSLTQVSAAFWGMLSIKVFAGKMRWRWLLWVACCIPACLSKESGFVFVACGPLFHWITGDNPLTRRAVARALPSMAAAAVIITAYLGTYVAMKQAHPVNSVPSANIVRIEPASPVPQADAAQWDRSTGSHRLTPVTFVKNLGILYGLGLCPVAVSGVYYREWGIVALTLCMAWCGPALLWRMWRRRRRQGRRTALTIAALGVFVSLPSLLTRAGEISPFTSNLFFIMAAGILVTGFRPRRTDLTLIGLFLTCTLITDSYKYSLALRGGNYGVEMGSRAAALTPADATRVAWVGVDENSRDRAGAAFNRSPYRGFGQGSAALRAMGYPRGLTLKRFYIADCEGAEKRAEELALALAPEFDCVWLSSGASVRVITRQ